MPSYGAGSKAKLATAHPKLQAVFNEAIKYTDITIMEGHRSLERQQQLYAQGRTAPGGIVTNVDGIRTKGKHNHDPSRAIDAVPYPVDWHNISRFHFMAGVVMTCAAQLGVTLSWGGNWKKLKDYPHFELVEP